MVQTQHQTTREGKYGGSMKGIGGNGVYEKKKSVFNKKKLGSRISISLKSIWKEEECIFRTNILFVLLSRVFFFEQIVKMLGQQWNKLHYLSLGIINLDKKGHISSLNGSNI